MRRVSRQPPAIIERRDDVASIDRNFRVLTPMFGGGVRVEGDPNRRQIKRPDAVTLVRAASVRGQLRFWWRATHGAQYPTIAEMREREALIWGAASQPGLASLAIDDSDVSASPVEVFEMVRNMAGKYRGRPVNGMRELAYGAFPLKPNDGLSEKLQPGSLTRLMGSLRLAILLRGHADLLEGVSLEVQDAVDAWLAFGGIGGRTRRGFGAVGASDPLDIVALHRRLTSSARQSLAGVPSFRESVLKLGPVATRDVQALSFGLKLLSEFRQGPRVGRNPGQQPNRPGRSRWPEAETIRVLQRRSDPQHRQRLVDVDAFPRARFGMPIITHFQSRSDPDPSTLTPTDGERLASPLHLGCHSSGENRIHPHALLLDDGVVREFVSLDRQRVRAQLRPDETRWRNSPLDGEPDPVRAFLKFYERNQRR